jgi:hypothetical protein
MRDLRSAIAERDRGGRGIADAVAEPRERRIERTYELRGRIRGSAEDHRSRADVPLVGANDVSVPEPNGGDARGELHGAWL